MERGVRLVLLWHLHQPDYRLPGPGGAAPARAAMPWVRMHAAAGYLDLAAALEAAGEGVRAVVNLTPVLVDQLGDAAAGLGDAMAPHHYLSAPPVVAGTAAAAALGGAAERRAALAARGAAVWSEADARDAEAVFHLCWFGWSARRRLGPRGLDALGRQRAWSADDVAQLRQWTQQCAAEVLPGWAALARAGRVELSTTPFFHPILPLLCDTDVARRARPGDALPRRFAHPEDARLQLERARALHARALGAAPAGLWPSEGSVSPEVVALAGAAGFAWLATDEGNLRRTPGAERADHRRPYRLGDVLLLFRDRDLSDRIGFRYAKAPPEEAAADFVAGVAGAPDGAVVTVALDGENPWETYPDRGERFLAALHGALARSGRVRCTTPSSLLAEGALGAAPALPTIHAGSWIESSFRIWIGQPEENRAWELLGEAREAAEAAGGEGRARSLEHLLAAEGSDWFWWFGTDFSTEQADLFDLLFRAHLRASYEARGSEPPAALAQPISAAARRGRAAAAESAARGVRTFFTPRVDGRAPYFEWTGAAVLRAGTDAGAMYAPAGALAAVHAGFDAERLHLRVDFTAPGGAAALSPSLQATLRFERPDGTPLAPPNSPSDADVAPARGSGGAPAPWTIEWRAPPAGVAAAVDQIAELSIPLPAGAARVHLTVSAGGTDRLPAAGEWTLAVPARNPADEDWIV
ncbi:MAG TPA: glycoside hydrolase family 57 protein [Myxococcota bacterium]|jgi:alpha-amylase/alpha-mannosidase (GH57 family)|nr:glycoside hydrolase family 57 protein [Myxococcota bacterium]